MQVTINFIYECNLVIFNIPDVIFNYDYNVEKCDIIWKDAVKHHIIIIKSTNKNL